MADNKSPISKLPPQNLEAEASLLGCLMIDKDAIFKIADTLQPADFYKDSHGLIYASMRELYAHHEPIDILTLTGKLEEKNQLETVGGRTYLAELGNSVTTSSHVIHYSSIIQRKATHRRLLSAAAEITELGYREDEEIEKLLDQAEQKLFGVSQKYLKNVFLPIDNLLTEAFDRIDELHKQSGKLRGLATGFPDLDNLLAGLQKSDLIILAARPSVGKTSLALDIARQAGIKSKTPIGIFICSRNNGGIVARTAACNVADGVSIVIF